MSQQTLPCTLYPGTAEDGFIFFVPLTKNEITFGPISILFCTKSLLKA